MNKVCLITHVADLDGAFPIVLLQQVYNEYDVHSCEIDEVDDVLESVLLKKDDYDYIYIVDLNISEAMADRIMNEELLKEKVLVFDHHESNMLMNKYPFISVVVDYDGRKECGTTLFYKYLNDLFSSSILEKPVVREMIELVRELDTYDFIENKKEDAFKLGALYKIYGREKFILKFVNYIHTEEHFYFTEIEQVLLEVENDRINRYIEDKLKEVKKANINGIPVGIVFAEENRSALGHRMAEQMLDIDIAIIINVARSVSYRAFKENVDVNDLAVIYGGGGHKHAGGSSLPKDLLEKISSYIFNEIEWK